MPPMNTHPDVPGQRLDFSGELHRLVFQLLTFLHIAAQLEFLFPCLIYSTFHQLNLILLVLDQFASQLHFAGS